MADRGEPLAAWRAGSRRCQASAASSAAATSAPCCAQASSSAADGGSAASSDSGSCAIALANATSRSAASGSAPEAACSSGLLSNLWVCRVYTISRLAAGSGSYNFGQSQIQPLDT